jgi:hypothetical protein
MKRCFSCLNKIPIEFDKQSQSLIRQRRRECGKGTLFIDDNLYYCAIMEKQIGQTDAACDDYRESEDHVVVINGLKEVVTKLKNETT